MSQNNKMLQTSPSRLICNNSKYAQPKTVPSILISQVSGTQDVYFILFFNYGIHELL